MKTCASCWGERGAEAAGQNITIYTNLCERAHSETYQLMCREASGLGANAIIAMGYDATELMTGLTEVLCSGTAVMVRREREDGVEEDG